MSVVAPRTRRVRCCACGPCVVCARARACIGSANHPYETGHLIDSLNYVRETNSSRTGLAVFFFFLFQTSFFSSSRKTPRGKKTIRHIEICSRVRETLFVNVRAFFFPIKFHNRKYSFDTEKRARRAPRYKTIRVHVS